VWQGNVAEVSQQFDEALKVTLQFQNDQSEIWSGMLANIELASPISRVLTMPESAVIADGEDAVEFVAGSNDILNPGKSKSARGRTLWRNWYPTSKHAHLLYRPIALRLLSAAL
jgi:hypothetical protein